MLDLEEKASSLLGTLNLGNSFSLDSLLSFSLLSLFICCILFYIIISLFPPFPAVSYLLIILLEEKINKLLESPEVDKIIEEKLAGLSTRPEGKRKTNKKKEEEKNKKE